ncbi:MAG: DUF2059 domain-containing protein [Bacteroidia bacterium]|nr:DUF2059 domain-containing protein [Bacteroidia bacterium]
MKVYLIALSWLFVALSFSNATAQDALDRDIAKLLELTGAKRTMMQSLDLMNENMKAMMPADVLAKLQEEMRNSLDEVVAEIGVIYRKHYTHEDIKGLIAFYQTPLGQKLLETTPIIHTESYQAGEQWGKKAYEKVINEMENK